MSSGRPPRARGATSATRTEAENQALATKAALAEQKKAKAAAKRLKKDADDAKQIGDATKKRRDTRLQRYAKRYKPRNIFEVAASRYDHRAHVAYTAFKGKHPGMTIEEYSRLEQMADEYNTVLFTYDNYLSSQTPSKKKTLIKVIDAARKTHDRVVIETSQHHASKSLQQIIGHEDTKARRDAYTAFESSNRENAEAQKAEWNKPDSIAKWTSAYGARKPIVCEFRPPGIEKFVRNTAEDVGAMEGDRKPAWWSWGEGKLIYLLGEREADGTIQVDFGPYFDANDFLPNYPEDIDEVMTGPRVAWAEEPGNVPPPIVRNLRYRRYVTPETRFLFNLRIMPMDELRRPMNQYLIDGDWKIWDRNQFFFWHNHSTEAERIYLNPIRRFMRNRHRPVGFLDDTFADERTLPMPDPQVQPNDVAQWREAPAVASFTAWLHHPILRHMQYERDRITRDTGCDINDFRSWHKGLEENQLALTRELRKRTLASLWAMYDVLTPEMRQVLAGAPGGNNAPVAVEEEDNDDVEAEDNGTKRDFPLPGKLAYSWSIQQSKKIWNSLKDKFSVAKMATTGNDADGVQVSEGEAAGGDLFGAGYHPPVDAFSGILDSDLMVEAQIGSVQTYVGTRVHFRLSLVFAGLALDPPGNIQGDQRVWCRIRDGGAFFPAANAGVRPANPMVLGDKQVFVREPPIPDPAAANPPPHAHRQVNAPTFVRDDIKTFMMAEGVNGIHEQLPFASFTREMEEDMHNGFTKLKYLINNTGRDRHDWDTEVFKIIGVEIPLVNPFCMFEGPATDKGKYRFFSTQCDFVALAWQKNVHTGNHRPRVVMGEFKAIMERSNPWKRLKDPRTLSQTMANAALFELQTGVRVDYAMQIYLVRPKPEVQECYASCTALDDFEHIEPAAPEAPEAPEARKPRKPRKPP